MSASPEMTADTYMDGIFGLGYKLPTQTTPRQPSVLSALTPLLDESLFAVDLRHHSSSGVYTFGRVDPARYTSPIRWVPLVPNATYWQLPYRGLHVGGQEFWYVPTKAAAATTTVIADTGTSLILLARGLVAAYYANVPSARSNESLGGIWTFPCNSTALPDLQVGFGGGTGGADDGAAWAVTVPGRYINYTVLLDDAATCMGGVQSMGASAPPFGILGDIFLKTVYAVFDVKGARVGFAEKVLDGEGA